MKDICDVNKVRNVNGRNLKCCSLVDAAYNNALALTTASIPVRSHTSYNLLVLALITIWPTLKRELFGIRLYHASLSYRY